MLLFWNAELPLLVLHSRAGLGLKMPEEVHSILVNQNS